jgi:hypothetical protein
MRFSFKALLFGSLQAPLPEKPMVLSAKASHAVRPKSLSGRLLAIGATLPHAEGKSKTLKLS